MRIEFIVNNTAQNLFWNVSARDSKFRQINPGASVIVDVDYGHLSLMGVANGRIIFGLADGRRVVVYLDDAGEWSGGGIMSQPNKCLSHDPVDMGMSWSFCRICNATMKFTNFEWKAS